MRHAARVAVLLGLLLAPVSACGSSVSPGNAASTSVRTGPLTPDDPARLSVAQHQAITQLVAASSVQPPAVAGGHGAHDAHGAGGQSTVPIDAAERRRFEEQWALASDAARRLVGSTSEAAANGYVRASTQGAGVGVHWVDWTLVDAPFDPTRPSMLLFDERDGGAELAGFSYWLRSDVAPEGFAGDADVWHQHANLCVVNGWIDRESVRSPQECAGSVLPGSDLWMLHAWVVPSLPNRWGAFATRHPALCPGTSAPDIARCPETNGAAAVRD